MQVGTQEELREYVDFAFLYVFLPQFWNNGLTL